MDLPRLGHAIIVNNIQAEIAGSASDVLALQRTYETVGFDVQVHTDCSYKVGKLVNQQIVNTWKEKFINFW